MAQVCPSCDFKFDEAEEGKEETFADLFAVLEEAVKDAFLGWETRPGTKNNILAVPVGEHFCTVQTL